MLSSIRRVSKPQFRRLVCGYHSYPDPNEKPILTDTISKHAKIINKADKPWSDEFSSLKGRFDMSKNFPGFENTDNAIDVHAAPLPKCSTLDNGLTVVSIDSPDNTMASFAFLIKRGSGDEVQTGPPEKQNTGSTFLLECTAFGPTKDDTAEVDGEVDTVSRKLNRIGGVDMATSSRENLIYFVDVIRENAETAMHLLANSILNPVINDKILDVGFDKLEFRHAYMSADVISRDAVCVAAYPGTGLGNHHFPVDPVSFRMLTPSLVDSYRTQLLKGDNCILSCSGIDHDTLVKIAEKAFGSLPKSSEKTETAVQRPKSLYKGGLCVMQRELQEPFVKIALAFEVGGYHSGNLFTACVLEKLLGGGSSFSAGGPGKGMYTRLYQEVLCRYDWIESAQGFVVMHDQNGLLGIDAACYASNVQSLFQVILHELVRLSVEKVSPLELSRAKNMLKSMLMMQLESRIITCEDLARQYATYGKRELPELTCKLIDNVTAEDIMELATEMIRRDPSIACVGEDVSHLPPYDHLKAYTHNYLTVMQEKIGKRM